MYFSFYSIIVRCAKLKEELVKKEKEISETGKAQEEKYVLCVSCLHFLLQKKQLYSNNQFVNVNITIRHSDWVRFLLAL